MTKLLLPTIKALGYDLVGIEYHPNSVNALLRVYIDNENGINLDDCVTVNEQINGILDVENPIASRYTLEVSSPGLDRPLFSIEDFERFIGEQVKIRLSHPIERKRNFKGNITAVNANEIIIEEKNDKQITLDFNFIEVARLIPTL